jgi:hypothetical protein
MCRVEKSTWYIFEKTLYSCDTPSCMSCSCKYLEIQRSSFLKFQYQATRIFLLCLFCFISIGCSRAMTWWIWSACAKTAVFALFCRDCTRIQAREISRSCTLLVRITYKTNIIEEQGTRTNSCWWEAFFDASYVSFNWLEHSEKNRCLLSSTLSIN